MERRRSAARSAARVRGSSRTRLLTADRPRWIGCRLLADLRLGRGIEHRGEVRDRALAVTRVGRTDREAVPVEVRTPCDFPQPEQVGVGLTVGRVAVEDV